MPKLCLTFLSIAALCGCQGGGCPDTNPLVANITVTPSTPCLAVTAKDSGSCGVIDHALEIKNACPDALVIGGKTINTGSTASLPIDMSDPKVCVGGSGKSSCSLTGKLGASTININFDVK